MGAPSLIVDVSSNNHPNGAPIDYAAAVKAGVGAAFVKATQGTTYVNPWLARDLAGFRAQGIPVLCYHYAEWSTAVDEAKWFARAVGRTEGRVLDGEMGTDEAWVGRFFDTLGIRGTRGLWYGSASYLARLEAPPVALWPADWTGGLVSPGFGVCWQYTNRATVPGIIGPVDCSRWTGTETQFTTLFGAAPPAPKPPTKPALSPIELPTLSVAYPGPSVSWRSVQRLQQMLRIPDDGRFGPGTEGAVKTFQHSIGIAVDGVVGPKTWTRLLNG